jgi:hypothetical protein
MPKIGHDALSHVCGFALSTPAVMVVASSDLRHADVPHEYKVDRPALFPPTFLYTQSWEDPEPDMKVQLKGG